MDYHASLGKFVDEPSVISEPVVITGKDMKELDYDLYRPRLGIPEGFCPRESVMPDIEKLIDRFIRYGYERKIPKDINETLRKHVEHFRNCLDVYDHIITDKVFSRDELYFRCLREGYEFTKFISKSRAQSLQDKITLIRSNTKEEYTHPEYVGYDSILHERYLINWDDRDVTIDWPWSFVEPKEVPQEEWEQLAETVVRICGIHEYDEDDIVPLTEPVAGKVTSQLGGKTVPLKDEWTVPAAEGGDYYATRRVVPTTTGKTRDTGVPEIESLLMLKVLHKHARILGEKCKYSANCDFDTLNKRVRRVKNKKTFLHVDFKKFGLTFNRGGPNAILDRIGKSHVRINSFRLEVEPDEIYLTKRGGVLGWFDPLVALVVIAILFQYKKEKNIDMDFIVFNDDVEIGFNTYNSAKLEVYRKEIIDRLEHFDFIISNRKVFASKEFIFLENYNDEVSALDLRKLQLMVNPYAKSLSTPWSWEAKLHYAMGHRYLRSWYLRDICQGSIRKVFEDEYEKPVEFGGWTFKFENGLNLALEEATPRDLDFFNRMLRYKEPHLMPKYRAVGYETIMKRKLRKSQEETLKVISQELLSTTERDEPIEMNNEEYEALVIMAEAPDDEDGVTDSHESGPTDSDYYGDWG